MFLHTDLLQYRPHYEYDSITKATLVIQLSRSTADKAKLVSHRFTFAKEFAFEFKILIDQLKIVPIAFIFGFLLLQQSQLQLEISFMEIK